MDRQFGLVLPVCIRFFLPLWGPVWICLDSCLPCDDQVQAQEQRCSQGICTSTSAGFLASLMQSSLLTLRHAAGRELEFPSRPSLGGHAARCALSFGRYRSRRCVAAASASGERADAGQLTRPVYCQRHLQVVKVEAAGTETQQV